MTRDISQASTHPDKVRPSSAVSRWSMDGSDVSDGKILDSWGSNDGSLNGSVTTGVSGVGGSDALSFDGSDDYIDCGEVSTVEPASGSFTISTWIYKASTSSQRSYVFERGHGADKKNLWLYWSDSDWSYNQTGSDELQWALTDDNNNRQTINVGDLSIGKWIHAVYIYDDKRGIVQAWLDGVKAGEMSVSASWSETTNFAIASKSDDTGSGEYWKGKIDEVRVYSEALSQQQIWKLYNIGRNANWGYTRS